MADLVLVVGEQNFSDAFVVRAGDNAFLFHALDQARGPIIADLEMALDEAGGSLPLAADHGHRLIVEIVARTAA